MRYGAVWCGVVWYGVVWYGMVWYGMVWCGMVWCSAVRNVICDYPVFVREYIHFCYKKITTRAKKSHVDSFHVAYMGSTCARLVTTARATNRVIARARPFRGKVT